MDRKKMQIMQVVDQNGWKPRSVVWELTLACNLRCGHCGSRAGRALENEMNTTKCRRP